MSSIAWYWYRLRSMDPRELPYRVLRSARTLTERLGAVPRATPEPEWPAAEAGWLAPVPSVDAAPYVKEAERILAGSIAAFEAGRLPLDDPPRWNRDPRSGREVPLRFGKTIDYRDLSVMGDAKYLWEGNRHHHLVSLAQAHALTGDARFSGRIVRDVTSWLAQCPFPLGPNWSNGLEAAIRLVNWAVTWELLGGHAAACFAGPGGEALRSAWLTSVYQHARFIRRYLSRFSSANNHLLGELTGLYLASLTWPCWADLRLWGADARRELVAESARQVAPDGVNREQATGYHVEAAQYFALAAVAGRASSAPFPAAFHDTLTRMASFLAAITDRGGHTANLGDSDGGSALRLVPPETDDLVDSCLATIAAATGSPLPRPLAGRAADTALWLAGERPVVGPAVFPQAYRDGGFYVLCACRRSPSEVLMVADAGPLGLEPLAAHGHADALSFTLSVGGLEFLVDPGTHDYYTESGWREYFRSTAAHNTVQVDGDDQSVPAGRFLWKHQAVARVIEWSENAARDVLLAEHDGYRRLPDPVTHRRRIELDKGARSIRVTDEFLCAGRHEVEWFWHFAEQCEVGADDGGFTATREGLSLRVRPPAGFAAALYHGDAQRPAGWRAPGFGVLVPSPTLAWRGAIEGDTTVETIFFIQTAD